MGHILLTNSLVWNEKNSACAGCYLVIYAIKHVSYLRQRKKIFISFNVQENSEKMFRLPFMLNEVHFKSNLLVL